MEEFMSDPKTQKHSTPDSLNKASKDAGIELSEADLKQVSGGQKVKGEQQKYMEYKLTDVIVSG
jgi:hypothetical protein